MNEIPQILQDAKAWSDELEVAKWKRIETSDSGRKIDPVYGLAWEDPNSKTKERYDLRTAYGRMKNPPDEKKPAPKKEDPKKTEKKKGGDE